MNPFDEYWEDLEELWMFGETLSYKLGKKIAEEIEEEPKKKGRKKEDEKCKN